MFSRDPNRSARPCAAESKVSESPEKA